MYRDEEYEALERAYFSAEAHEKEALALVRELLRGAILFGDVGASLGQFTLGAAEAMRGGRIVAVEADPDRFVRLESNCRKWAAANGCDIKAHHAAAVNKDGPITFFSTDSRVSGGLFVHDTSHSGAEKPVQWREVTVPGRRLDDLFPGSPPDVVKMDIEGAEFRALQGAAAMLAKRHTLFLIELHEWADPAGHGAPGDVRALMRGYGYTAVPLAGKHLFIPRRKFGVWARYATRSFLQRARRKLKGLLPL